MWLCMNCLSMMELDVHGRCSVCHSDSVDIAVRPCVTPESLAATFLTVEELERMMEE